MASHPYDIRFTLNDGSKYGFMLSTPPGQSKQLNLIEVQAPSYLFRRLSGNAADSHLDFDAQLDMPFAMVSLANGLGQMDFDEHDDEMYWWGSGVVTHVPGRAYLAPPASALAVTSGTTGIRGITSYLSSGGTRYDFAWGDKYIWRRDASNATNAWAIVYTQPNNDTVTDFKIFNGVGVIAFASSTGTPDFSTATTLTGVWVVTTRNHAVFSSGTRPKYFVPVRGTLFALVDNNQVFLTVDPTQDGWIGPIETTVGSLSTPTTGDGTYPFQGGIAVNDYLFILSQNAGYSIDADQNVLETFWQWKDKPSADNFQFSAAGGDQFVYNIGPEVYSYDPGTGNNLSPRISRQSGFSTQQVLGVDADNQYIYILAQVRVPLIRSAVSVALLRCARISGTRWSIECLWEDTAVTETYSYLKACPNGLGTRLYWGMVNGGATSTYVMDIPADWDESTGASFAGTGTLYTSIARVNYPGLSKRHLWINFESDGGHNLTPKLAVAYSTDKGATFTSLGDTQSGASGITKLEYANVASRSLVLRYTFTTGGTSTAVLRVFDQHSRARFRYLPQGQASVRIAQNVERNNGTRDESTVAQLQAALLAIRESDNDILYEDYLGNSFNVSIDSIGYHPSRHEKLEERGELEAQIVFSCADSGD